MPEITACLFSGGKDSTLALHKAVESGIKVDLLITMLPERTDSYMFHYPNLNYTPMQAEALGIKQVFAKSSGIKEEELKDLESALIKYKANTIITGATYSDYQANRIIAIAERLGMNTISPLWHINPMSELNELSEKFNVIITAVSAEGFDRSMLGKKLDNEMINKLAMLNKKYKVNMLFEGGEAESFVLDAPLFKKRIIIKKAKTSFNKNTGTYIIEEAVFEDKLQIY
jgi:ABC transporter with metal-binding/Fe-S-binding domain ATP-binding protein